MTAGLITQLQKGDGDSTLILIKKYTPLLKKYAYKLFYDDAYNDLLVDFIELLHNIKLDHLHDRSEGGLVSYICTSIHSSYIKRSIAKKKLYTLLLYSDLSDSELYWVDTVSSTYDTYFALELTGISHVLSESELSIIKSIYLSEYKLL